MTELHIDYVGLPASVNRLYFVKFGRKVLSTEGRKYKNAFLLSCGGMDASEFMKFVPQPEAKYELQLWFYVKPENLYNLTYGKNKRVKSPYADMDTTNMIKLIEDCISELTGIRDRNNFIVCARKCDADDGVERVKAILRPIDEKSYG